jgi:hypothetical protein
MRVTGDDTTFTAESDVDVDFSVNDLAGADRGLRVSSSPCTRRYPQDGFSATDVIVGRCTVRPRLFRLWSWRWCDQGCDQGAPGEQLPV